MSGLLWKYFLENDIDRFRHTLARASYNASSQGKAKGGGLSSSPGNTLSTSPTVTRGKKQNERHRGNQARGKGGDESISLSQQGINWKDGQGRTLLHHIASSRRPNAHEYAEALLQLQLLDLYVQDDENGWTALHRAFYFNNITIARALMDKDVQDALQYSNTGSAHIAGGLIKIKDREGYSPFDVYGTTIASRMIHGAHIITGVGDSDDEDAELAHGVSGDANDDEENRRLLPRVQINGDEMFAFGSNKNLTLGLGDEDDRQFPERVYLQRPDHLMYRFHEEYKASAQSRRTSGELCSKPFGIFELPAIVRYRPTVVQDVQLSKLSSAILTTDPEANLYMCGFGKGGRLGTGDETTRFSYVVVQGGGLASRKIIAVALGQSHTLAITNQGETFAWGSNAFGMLGFAPNTTSKDEEPVQLLPKQVYGPLKRETAVGAAASRIHSAIFTASSLYTFGKNEGQMGLVDSDARSLISQNTPRKVGASLFTSPIKSVIAIEKATICLLESHEVMVFANYGYTKVNFQVDSSAKFRMELGQSMDRFAQGRPVMRGNEVTKIAAGGDTICAMTSLGDVYTINVTQPLEPSTTPSSSTTNPSKIKGALSPPQLIWSLKKAHMAIRDVDVGQDGSIIICTESGSVWRRTKRAKIKDATATSSATYKAKDYKFSRVPSLTRIVAVRSNTFGAYAAVRRDTDILQTQLEVEDPTLWEDLAPLQPFHGFGAEDSDTEEPTPRFWVAGQSTDLANLRRAVLTNVDLEEELAQFLSNKYSADHHGYDLEVGTTVSDVRIPIHSFILAGRSTVMEKALSILRDDYFFSVPEVVNVEYDNRGNPLVLFQGIDILTLLNLVLYVYTDNVVDVWQYTRRSPELALRYRQIRTELMKVASHLELRKLEHAVRLMTHPPKSLNADLEQAIRSPTYFDNGDVKVELDGARHLVHSAFVCQRCPFFEGLFRGRAGGRWLATRRDKDQGSEAVRVDLSHVDPHIFSFVLRHIYADADEAIFNDVVTADLDAYLDLMIEVMSVANELMLDRLAQSCQKVLGRYVTTRNVCQLINAVAPCSVTDFKDAALEYICLNLEGMLENHLLGELDHDLMLELDEVVRQNQLTCMPVVKSGKAEADLMERHPVLAERLDHNLHVQIDRAYLSARVQEKERRTVCATRAATDLLDDSETSSSHKSPNLGLKDRRQSDAKSPMLGAKGSAHDLMFDMEELDEDRSKRPSTHKRRHLYDRDATLELQETAYPRSIEAFADSASLSSSQGLNVSGPRDASSREARTHSGSQLPWAQSPVTTPKLDMKEIMAQASTPRTSKLSSALAVREKQPQSPRSTPAKLSQKERKKLQQQQALASSPISEAPTPSPQTSEKPAPWQRTTSGPRVSLNDVPGAEASSPSFKAKPSSPATPTMTLRQTVSGSKPPARRIASEPDHSTSSPKQTVVTPASIGSSKHPQRPTISPPRSLSSYTPPVPPVSSIPTINSIRHTSPPATADSVLHLSMDDILAQQQTEKDVIKGAATKRSLMEIQEEQAFQEWWDEESRKVQERENTASKSSRGRTRVGDHGRRGQSRGRGRGGAKGGKEKVDALGSKKEELGTGEGKASTRGHHIGKENQGGRRPEAST